MCGVPRPDGHRGSERSASRRSEHACNPEANQDDRQLLAIWTTLYDYIYRAMPFNAPQSLTPVETYSVIAWLLFQNKVIAEDAVIDAQSLPKIEMPNRNGFVPDPRPDVRAQAPDDLRG